VPVAAAEEAPALASVPAVAALVECQEVAARELADLVLVAGLVQRVHQEAFGKVAVVDLAPEEVWEPEAPRVVEPGVVLAADQVRAREEPEGLEAGPEAGPEVAAAALALVRVEEPALAAVGLGLVLAAVGLGLVLAVGRGLAAEARAPVAELVAGKPLESG
jgi:hypothetical protein